MKSLLFMLVFLSACKSSFAQIINGIVIDKSTKDPIEFAYIYFNGSSVGTQSDINGKFVLDVSKTFPNPLTVSAIDYYSLTVFDYQKTSVLTISLTPKPIELAEVNISEKSLSRKRTSDLKIFKNVFLGTTENSSQCEILNESDIRFNYESDRDTLRATSLNPLIINNKALGYQLTYYLDNFEYDRSTRSFSFQGNLSFKEKSEANTIEKSNLVIKRSNAYLGSRMHFFRSLWSDELEANGFTIKNNFGRNLTSKEIVFQDALNRKYIKYDGILSICYLSDVPFSHLEILTDRVYFDKNGYCDPYGPVWDGYILEKKVADMLPLEYIPMSENLSDLTQKDLKSPLFQNEKTPEKIYLHFDRDIYYPGDDLWFKAYIVDGLNHTLTGKSENLHVELISPGSKLISMKVVKTENGLGNGDIILPDSLRSGDYMIRAYTNYIRNFGDQLFFKKEISVINSVNPLAITAAENNQKSDKDFEINFFPEGGSLVENVESAIAFKAIDDSGKGCNVKGEIYSSEGKKITSFESTHLGMGKFLLTPVPSTSYYAIVYNAAGTSVKKDLPKAFLNGFALNALTVGGNQHLISINTNTETFSDTPNCELIITYSYHKKILYSRRLQLSSLRSALTLPVDSLPEGIVMVTISDLNNKPLCERLFYNEHSELPTINLLTDKEIYNHKDSVKLKISLDSGTNDEAYLSLSVSDSTNCNNSSPYPTTITSWFLLESDIRGSVEDPSYYFDPSNAERLTRLDLLLLTQGWRDFEWKYNGTKYSTENSFRISGKLYRSITDSPIKGEPIDIGIFQDNKNLFSSVNTDSLGRFQLFLEDLMGTARVVITANGKKGKSSGRILIDSMTYDPPELIFKPVRKTLTFKDNYSLYKTDSIKKDIKRKYTLSDTILIGEVTITGKKKQTPQEIFIDQGRTIYGQPDKEIIIAPNESARTVRDLLIGKVAGLTFIRPKSRGESGIRIHGVTSSLSLTGDPEPLFLLDGLVVPYAQINAIPMEFIDRVDVLKSEKTTAFGMRGANGVISVITKIYKDLQYKPVGNSVSTTISGYDTQRIFYSPKYETISPNMLPDLITTLHWQPDIKINTNKEYIIKYLNSEITSKYRIKIEGITSHGLPVSRQIQYSVLPHQ